jgi:hypothetical protein
VEAMINDRSINQHVELRKRGHYPRSFLRIRPMNGEAEFTGALMLDSSQGGISVVTTLELPAGTELEIKTDEDLHAIGKVVGVTECDEWDWCGMVRLSLQFINQDNWNL